MADTILGYPVASPEQQRKTALAILGFVAVAVFAGLGVVLFITHMEQSGREQAVATIKEFTTKCRYRVRNISRRVSYYDHTGYIDCPTANRVAAENDNPMGHVQQTTFARVSFVTRDGVGQDANVELGGSAPFAIGQQVEILYRADNPADVSEFRNMPFGMGKNSIIEPKQKASAVSPPQRSTELNPQKKERASDSLSKSAKMWIGFGVLLLLVAGAYYLLRLLYRAFRWLILGPRSPDAEHRTGTNNQGQRHFGQVKATHPMQANRMARVVSNTARSTDNPPRSSFGHRRSKL